MVHMQPQHKSRDGWRALGPSWAIVSQRPFLSSQHRCAELLLTMSHVEELNNPDEHSLDNTGDELDGKAVSETVDAVARVQPYVRHEPVVTRKVEYSLVNI